MSMYKTFVIEVNLGGFFMIEELRAIVGYNEKIFYEGKPDKKCYIFESIFNPLLPFALLWGILDISIVGGVFKFGSGNMLFFFIPFILLHMMPVWIYLGGILFTARRYKNTAYIVTDRAIYIAGGVFTRNITTKSYF